MKKNNKGFTLIELLAVIVILAVLILVALPAVTNLMQRARKSAFRAEVLSMAREGVQLAYSANMVSGIATAPPSDNANKKPSGTVFSISGGEYLCMTFDDLVNKGYIEKTNRSGYAGYIQLYVPSSITDQNNTGRVEMYIKMTNGTYQIVEDFKTLSETNDVDTKVTTGTTGGACPAVTASTTTWANLKGK